MVAGDEMTRKHFLIGRRLLPAKLCGILAAIMSTADSQLLVSASAIAEDIYKGVIKKDADDKKVLNLSRIAIVVIAVVAYIIALDPNSSVMTLVSDAWAGLGAAFGPLVLMSLFRPKRSKFCAKNFVKLLHSGSSQGNNTVLPRNTLGS